jgi:GT2 family glycosyltransferase
MGTQEQQISGCKGSNMSFRKSICEVIGGFDRQTELLEDADFSRRVTKAGWKLMFLPEAEVVHLSSSTGGVRLESKIDSERRRFRSTAYYIVKHRGWLGLVPFIITFTLIALKKALQFKSPSSFFTLLAEIKVGILKWLEGPAESLTDPNRISVTRHPFTSRERMSL